MRQIILLITISTFFTSCEKNIDFKLKNADAVLVVDAQIENAQAPTVALSKSLDYFGAINPQILANSFVHNAEVTMSNGTVTHTFKEYTVPLGNGYSLYYYSIDSANLATAFVGDFNKQSSSTIISEGKV